MDRFTIDDHGNIVFDVNGDYEIIDNPGGGDCFFHSIIDSGLLQHYRDFDGISRKDTIRLLRWHAVKQIKRDLKSGNIVVLKKNISGWLERMMDSSYWADDYMISAIQKVLDFRIILIGDNGRIYCNSPYEKKVRIRNHILDTYGIKRDDDYVFNFNSVEKLESDNGPFIIIWYKLNVHFEVVKYKGKAIFAGYESLKRFVPNLVKKYVAECRLVSKEDSCYQTLYDLKHIR